MTEVVENSTTTNNAPVDLSGHPDATISKLWAKVKADEPKMWELHEEIQKSSPPSAAEVEAVLKESDDPEVVALRKQIEAAETRLKNAKEKAREYVLSGYETLPEEEVTKLKDEFRNVATRVRTVIGLVKDVADNLGIEGVDDELKRYQYPTLRGVGSTAPRTTGDGGPRPQVTDIAVSKNGKDPKHYDKLSFAATYAGVKTADMYAAWLDKAGQGKWQEIKEPVTFTMGEDDGIEVTVTPRG